VLGYCTYNIDFVSKTPIYLKLPKDTTPITEESCKQYVLLVAKTVLSLGLLDKVKAITEQVILQQVKEAQSALAKETQAEEGSILRHIPIIGGVWDWLNPVPEVKGKSFDLRGMSPVRPSATKNSPQLQRSDSMNAVQKEQVVPHSPAPAEDPIAKQPDTLTLEHSPTLDSTAAIEIAKDQVIQQQADESNSTAS